MPETDLILAGHKADTLIATEVAIQDRMWGETNERADADDAELLQAATAQLILLCCKHHGATVEEALDEATLFYPADWTGLRDYGSDIANLVVAAAYIRSEIKRRVLLGEDTTRSRRDAPYRGAGPHVSAEVAAALVSNTPPVK